MQEVAPLAPIETLPKDVLLLILGRLFMVELFQLRRVNKQWKKLIEESKWKWIGRRLDLPDATAKEDVREKFLSLSHALRCAVLWSHSHIWTLKEIEGLGTAGGWNDAYKLYCYLRDHQGYQVKYHLGEDDAHERYRINMLVLIALREGFLGPNNEEFQAKILDSYLICKVIGLDSGLNFLRALVQGVITLAEVYKILALPNESKWRISYLSKPGILRAIEDGKLKIEDIFNPGVDNNMLHDISNRYLVSLAAQRRQVVMFSVFLFAMLLSFPGWVVGGVLAATLMGLPLLGASATTSAIAAGAAALVGGMVGGGTAGAAVGAGLGVGAGQVFLFFKPPREVCKDWGLNNRDNAAVAALSAAKG